MIDWEKSGLFKAFAPTIPGTKQAAVGYTKEENWYSLQEMQTKNGFLGLLADDAIMLDADTEENSEALMKIIQGEKLSCMVTQRENGRGIHALFFNVNGTVPQNHTSVMLACGITVDIKIGARNGYDCLKFDGNERFIVYDGSPYQNIPKYFLPLKGYKADFTSMDEGDGRNQALFNYILTLQSFDFTNEEIRETIGIKSYTDELKRAYEGIDRCKEAVLNYQEYLEYYQKRLEDLENGADEFSLSDDTLIEKWLANEDERIKAYQDELEKFLNEEGDENES